MFLGASGMRREFSLHTHILRLSGVHFQWLPFAPTLEQQFSSEASRFRSRRQWLEGLFGIGLYVVFAVASGVFSPHAGQHPWLLRFGFVLPFALVVNVGALLCWPTPLREAGIMAASCAAGSVEVLLCETTGVHQDACAQLAVVAVFVFTHTVMRLRLPCAALAFGWGLGVEGLLLLSRQSSTGPTQIFPMFMTLTIGVLTLTANYSQEREARLAFLKEVEKQELVGSLAQTNEKLTIAALTDGLTKLPNRAALDAHLATIWPNLARSESICSIVLVDIDHFKGLNDRYGHLYGDRVLKRVARLLAEALRGEDDFIARFGGEEFVVILPDTPGHLACLVAERLRGLVELAGLPSLRTGDPSLQGLRATISCGVAMTFPHLEPDPYVALGTADEALYRAKREGRNLVRDGFAGEALPPFSPAIPNDKNVSTLPSAVA